MNRIENILKKLFSIEALVVLYFFALLLFGKEFTKFKVLGPLYLHDLVLGIITLLVINNRKKLTLRFPAILILLCLSFLYLFTSLIFYRPSGGQLIITFRQFNLIVYLFCAYIIFNVLVRNGSDIHMPIALIKIIAYASMLLQVVFIVYGYIFIPGFGLFSEGEYNYFSPLVIFGVISYGGYVLAVEPVRWKRYVKFLFCVLLSTTLGHSSAFFALFVILVLYAFIRIKPIQRIIAAGLCVVAISFLFFLPQFTDVNAGWRLLFWKHVLHRLIVEKYTLFGFGFGQPYMTSEYAVYLNKVLNSPIMMDSYDPLARYVTPPHNSLVTFAFHLGILPALLLFVPLRKYVQQVFFKPVSQDVYTNLLLYVFSGSTIWIAFNVILELPHSATYYWLIYFTTIAYFNYSFSEPFQKETNLMYK